MQYYAIIVAGGSGSRMQSDIPKQFLLLHGKPVLMHTIEAFYYSQLKPRLILVLNKSFHADWADLCKEHHFSVPHQLVEGGPERFHSVKNGLSLIHEDAVIAIHDAVRPLISDELITRSFRTAEEKGSAVCGIASKDSVRRLTDTGSEALNRLEIFLVQTPQTFDSRILNKAYQQNYSPGFTDDASVVEKSGFPVHLIEGETGNLKITYPDDLAIAEVLMAKKIRP